MRSSASDTVRLLVGAALALAPLLPLAPGVDAQEREVVSKEIAVGRDEAALRLGFADDGSLEVSFSDGVVRVNEREIARYVPGDALETAWRSLLGQAVSLDDGPLSRLLVQWSPPEAMGDGQEDEARELDRALEEALAPPRPAAAPPAPAAPDAPAADALVRSLLENTRRLSGLAEALEGMNLGAARVHVGDDVEVGADEVVEGTILVVDADLDLAGRVEGDVIMVDGALHLEEGGVVTGDVRLVDARLFRNGGSVSGSVSNVHPGVEGGDADEVRRELREEMRRELREELRREIRQTSRDAFRFDGFTSPIRSLVRGVTGLVENLVSLLIVGGLVGGLAVHFGGENLDVVGRTVRRAPLRAGMVGLAGAFVAVPAWVLGFVALALSIVGILAIPFWAVLFPLAVVAGAAFGYVAVAQLVGEWVSRQDISRLEWVRTSNPYSTVIAGVGALMLAFMAANVLEMAGPWTGFFQGLLTFVGTLAGLAAVLVGFGAVLLTRGGRRPEYYPGGDDPLGDWDLGLDPRPTPPRPRPSGSGTRAGGTGSGSASAREAPATPGGEGPSAPGTGSPTSGTAPGTGSGRSPETGGEGGSPGGDVGHGGTHADEGEAGREEGR